MACLQAFLVLGGVLVRTARVAMGASRDGREVGYATSAPVPGYS